MSPAVWSFCVIAATFAVAVYMLRFRCSHRHWHWSRWAPHSYGPWRIGEYLDDGTTYQYRSCKYCGIRRRRDY